jgi:hypothetical protein
MGDSDVEVKYMDIVYIDLFDKYKDDFRRIELELLKEIKTIPPRRIVFREAFYQNSINQYEYDCLMEWEDEYAPDRHSILIQAKKKKIKEPKLANSVSVTAPWKTGQEI